MKVAIWGSYAYGNYGDELMAIQFALAVRRFGAHPVVYALDEGLGRRYSIAVTRSVDELIRGATLCVFGGGSLLSHKHGTPRAYARAKEEEYNDFCNALRRYACPLYLLSIGGDGDYSSNLKLTPFRQQVLRYERCYYATVRSQADCKRLEEHYGIPSAYYPDVLLGIRDFFDVPNRRAMDGTVNIGLNLSRSYARVASVLCRLVRIKRNVVLHFIKTVRQKSESGNASAEVSPSRLCNNVRVYAYDDPYDTLGLLGSLDLVISCKLHLGLTSLALGTPFVSLRGPLKCKAFLSSIGAESAYWNDTGQLRAHVRVLLAVFSKKTIKRIQSGFDFSVIERQKELSYGHLQKLGRLIGEPE